MNKCHFIGIGGIGMSGLAQLLLNKNIPVSGSDVAETAMVKTLHKQGADIFIGQNERNIEKGSTVIYSSSIAKDNPEYLAAIDKKCRLIHRSELLRQIMEDYDTLAVTGTHGKTTTSALLAAVLHDGGLDPSFAVGGVLPQFGSNAQLGKGSFFVAEADESDGSFLRYHPKGAIITNIGLDHMDYFGAIETVVQAYQTFISQVQDSALLFWCGDDPRLAALAPQGTSYGLSENSGVQGRDIQQVGWKTYFDICYKGSIYREIELSLIGTHNVRNALAVFGLAMELGVSEHSIRQAFASFGGIKRRTERKGSKKGITVVDDYAHHPKEIATTLAGLRQAVEEKRLIALFQPHRYSRTKDNWNEYRTLFKQVDLLLVTDIYSAGENPIEGVSGESIAAEIKQHTKVPVVYAPRSDLLNQLLPLLRPHDVVVTLGAGDITSVGDDLLNQLDSFSPKKWRVGLVYGGRSIEHEISLKSARYMHNSLNPSHYDLEFIGITKEGKWLCEDSFPEGNAVTGGAELNESTLNTINSCDILLPVLHGPFGEDGTIQGFFDMLGKAYVGCSHRAAAVAMDKALTKRVMANSGILTSPFIDVSEEEWHHDPGHILEVVKAQLSFPVYVKPIHLGSSVGVARVETPTALSAAIDDAFQHDNKILIENEIVGREIEFAVFGNNTIHVFPPGEILRGEGVYSFQAKYGDKTFETSSRAELPQEVIDEGMFLAERAYQAIEGSGLARIDFFLDNRQRIWFNEVNPMPGFTPISLYPQMCLAAGYSAEELMNRLICFGFERKRRQKNYAVLL